jgi:hypothetical protein
LTLLAHFCTFELTTKRDVPFTTREQLSTMHTAATAPLPELLHAVRDAPRPHDLIAVGSAYHYFTQPARNHLALDLLDAHRATTVLTKQVARLLVEDRPLALIAALVTEPLRPALPNGTTAAELCGDSWNAIRDIARERVQAAIDGAEAFGERAVLHLAATRAADATTPWWGTAAWSDAVERAALGRRATMLLLRDPESAADADLRAVLGLGRRTSPGTLAGDARPGS